MDRAQQSGRIILRANAFWTAGGEQGPSCTDVIDLHDSRVPKVTVYTQAASYARDLSCRCKHIGSPPRSRHDQTVTPSALFPWSVTPSMRQATTQLRCREDACLVFVLNFLANPRNPRMTRAIDRCSGTTRPLGHAERSGQTQKCPALMLLLVNPRPASRRL